MQVRGGGPNLDDWIEGLALSLLSGLGGRVEIKKALYAGGPSSVDFLYLRVQRSSEGCSLAQSMQLSSDWVGVGSSVECSIAY